MLQTHSLFPHSYCTYDKYAANLLGFRTLHHRYTITSCHVFNALVIPLPSFELLCQTILQINQAKLQIQCALSYARQRRTLWKPGEKLDQRQHPILVRTSFLVIYKVASDTLASTHICSSSPRTLLLVSL